MAFDLRTYRSAGVVCCVLAAGCGDQSSTVKPTVEPSVEQTAPLETGTAASGTADDSEAVVIASGGAKATGLDAAGFVTSLDFREQEVTSEVLAVLPKFSRLQSLLFNDSNLDDSGLQFVGQCQQLTNLDLRDCPISNDGLQHLTGLKQLKALRLSGKTGATTVDDEGLSAIGQISSLKALLLDFLWVSGAGLSELKNLTRLEELYLAGTLVGDEDLEQLNLFPKLKKLRVAKLSQLGRPGMESIARLSALEELDLSENSAIFDDELAPISGLKSLKRLNLWRVALTDAGVAHLQGLTNLVWLNLDNTQLTDAGLPSLQQMQKLEFLHLGSTAITDSGLSQLAGLTSLKDLKVTRTAVTEAGVAELQKQLPKTEIQLKYLGTEE